MVASYVRLGRLEDARKALKQALEAEPQWTQLNERNNHLERPYKDPAVFERQLADLAAAGLPELPFGYDGGSEDRLSSEEIKAMMFGHTLLAKDMRSGSSFTDIVASDGTIQTSSDFGKDTATIQYLGNSLICYRWKDVCTQLCGHLPQQERNIQIGRRVHLGGCLGRISVLGGKVALAKPTCPCLSRVKGLRHGEAMTQCELGVRPTRQRLRRSLSRGPSLFFAQAI